MKSAIWKLTVPLALAGLAAPQVSAGQQAADTVVRQDTVFQLAPINVTATRTPISVFNTPSHVSVISGARLRSGAGNNLADLFLDLPGLDAEGVGPVQRKPVIRGMIGQRILLLRDGLRVNNTRREQDRNESPALAEGSRVERVEVVRGAASVLYGSDAVGGVVNVITSDPADRPDGVTRGSATAGFGTAGDRRSSSVSLWRGGERFSFDFSSSYRKSNSYRAPGGTFGDLTLPGDIRVNDTGVEDYSLSGSLTYSINANHRIRVGQSYYRALDAGFGYVEPIDLGASGLKVQLLFPDQKFARTTARYRGTGLGSVLADRVDVSAYYQSNERSFNTIVSGPLGPPGAALNSLTENFTDIDTWGSRVEARKLIAGTTLFTYGADFFRDGSENADTSTRTVTGFGPPSTRTSGTRIPNARFYSTGVFAQGEVNPIERLSLTLGARFQNVSTSTDPTAGIAGPQISSSDRTVVGAANILYRLTGRLNVVASIGRAFRSPNLVERFFTGVSPDGRAYWSVNPDLTPETSLNREVGLKFMANGIEVEGYAFRNTVHDGIQDIATGATVDGLPERRNQNLDEIRFTGYEFQATFRTDFGLSGVLGLSHLSGVADTSQGGSSTIPGETYATKVAGRMAYTIPGGAFTLEYGVRANSSKDDVDWRSSPLGDVAPSFVVHSASVQLRPFGAQTIRLSINNLFNKLYAETGNMAFFRPEPGRNLNVTVLADF